MVDPFLAQHELRKRIFRRFRTQGTEIPFPQRAVRIRGGNQGGPRVGQQGGSSMIRRNLPTLLFALALGLLVLGMGACTQRESPTSPAGPIVEQKSFPLSPSTATVKASFLTGKLEDMKVWERVEQGTGKVVEAPKLLAMLKLKNTSANQAARPINGRIEYLDAQGKPIPLAEGREDTSFKFPYYQERLDPGMETSVDINVPFPAAALKEKKLQDIRLELTYIPSPYKEESVSIQVSLEKK